MVGWLYTGARSARRMLKNGHDSGSLYIGAGAVTLAFGGLMALDERASRADVDTGGRMDRRLDQKPTRSPPVRKSEPELVAADASASDRPHSRAAAASNRLHSPVAAAAASPPRPVVADRSRRRYRSEKRMEALHAIRFQIKELTREQEAAREARKNAAKFTERAPEWSATITRRVHASAGRVEAQRAGRGGRRCRHRDAEALPRSRRGGAAAIATRSVHGRRRMRGRETADSLPRRSGDIGLAASYYSPPRSRRGASTVADGREAGRLPRRSGHIGLAASYYSPPRRRRDPGPPRRSACFDGPLALRDAAVGQAVQVLESDVGPDQGYHDVRNEFGEGLYPKAYIKADIPRDDGVRRDAAAAKTG